MFLHQLSKNTTYLLTYCMRACVLFQAELQTGDEASTCARSTSPVPSSSNNSTTDITMEPSDGASTTTIYSSLCTLNMIQIDYPVNEMKKMLARHIACGVAELSKLRCNGCEIDHPSQLQHDCLLPDDILIDIHFDEAVEKVISTAVIRDWLILLLAVDLTQSNVEPEQLNAVKSWLEEYPSERWRNNGKRMVLDALEEHL